MLTSRVLPLAVVCALALVAAPAVAPPAAAQELASHRAAYVVSVFDRAHGVPGGTIGNYAFEIRDTCEGYVINQRMRLDIQGGRTPIVSEQQTSMLESKDGKKFRFEHRATANGKLTGDFKGEALLGSPGQARFTTPDGQTVALPAETLFPVSIARQTLRRAKSGEGGFDAPFFFGDKVKPPQSANIVIGKVPKRLADLPVPDGAQALVTGHDRVYFRGAFFDADSKGAGEPIYEMSSVTLDNGVELYGTNEQSDTAIEYRLTKLEALQKTECK